MRGSRPRSTRSSGVYLGIAELRREDPELLRTPAGRRAYLADLEATLKATLTAENPQK
jgi:hypothetical protein